MLHKPNFALYRKYVRAFGIKGVPILRKIHFDPVQKQTEIVSINLLDYLGPIYIRTGISDRDIFTQIFVYKEDESTSSSVNPEIIVDEGANIRFSRFYFEHTYPQAKIFAVEPEEFNFRMLVQNKCA